MAAMKNIIIDWCEYMTMSTAELTPFEKALYLELCWADAEGKPTAIGEEIYKTYGLDESLWA
jgi:hypothetical protein